MDESLAAVLKILEKRLKPIRWILIGSSALYLQGIDVEFHDIDLLCDGKDAYQINKLLKEYEVRPVSYSEAKIFRSHFGEFKIKGIKVEVMGDLEHKLDGIWNQSSDRFKEVEYINYMGIKIPVFSLRSNLEAYRKFGREKDKLKLKKIEERLNQEDKDFK